MSKPPHSQRGNHPQQARQPQQVQQVHQVQVQQWSGPLPPPAELERFNQIVPNGAERIVAMAEKEQAHRIEYEKTGLQATTLEFRRGQFMGAAISLAAVLGAVYVVTAGGHWSVSVALVSVPVLGLVKAIVKPRA